MNKVITEDKHQLLMDVVEHFGHDSTQTATLRKLLLLFLSMKRTGDQLYEMIDGNIIWDRPDEEAHAESVLAEWEDIARRMFSDS